MPFEGAPPLGQSLTEVSFSLSRDELLEIMTAAPQNYFLPDPVRGSDFARSIACADDSAASHQRLADWFMNRESYTFNLTHVRSLQSDGWAATAVPSFGCYPVANPGPNGAQCAVLHFDPVGRRLVARGQRVASHDIGVQILPSLRSRLYVFQAERLNVGECNIGNNPDLMTNAANLPAVLNLLQNNRVRYERFNAAVCTVLPQVPWVSVRPTKKNQNNLEILTWPFSSHPDREDLAIPLKDSGTGLGQVLSILYVVLTSTQPKVIVIDEPQSFLHPGAARKLIEVLKRHPEHQYIVATHSPETISAAGAKTVTMARLAAGETVIEQASTTDARWQETLLAELGVRLSDVFGSDNVLWVEGQTEEFCFKNIIENLGRKHLMGTQILGVRHTGDFEGDAAERTIEIYNKISSSGGVIPPAMAFVFDSECRSAQKKKELVTKSKSLLHFLPRRMYENYLLSPAAISSIATAIENFRTNAVTADEVSKLLDEALSDPDLYCDRSVPGELASKVASVHAKVVLRRTFAKLSETRVAYNVLEHGRAITEWLVANEPTALTEITDLLDSLLDSDKPPTGVL
ncbi:MAG: AAA family ATPase [Candidatus Acidiferrales bacterium]